MVFLTLPSFFRPFLRRYRIILSTLHKNQLFFAHYSPTLPCFYQVLLDCSWMTQDVFFWSASGFESLLSPFMAEWFGPRRRSLNPLQLRGYLHQYNGEKLLWAYTASCFKPTQSGEKANVESLLEAPLLATSAGTMESETDLEFNAVRCWFDHHSTAAVYDHLLERDHSGSALWRNSWCFVWRQIGQVSEVRNKCNRM